MKYNFTFFFIISIFYFSTAQTIDATLVELNFHGNSTPQNMTASKSGFYFTATDDYREYGRELWYSNGTIKGTAMVKDIKPGSNSSDPTSLISVNNILYFTASDGIHGMELWKSDGSKSGTSMIKDIKPNNNDNYNGPSNLLAFNGKLYFTATNDTNGFELWTSDGTESGTQIVKDINPNGDSNPNGLFVFNNSLYFTANDGTNGIELWKSDGTESGTSMIKNINTNSNGLTHGNQFLIMNNNFYFFANDGIKGYELWKSDGTESGTQIVKDIRVGNNFNQLVLKGAVLNNIIVFEGNEGINGTELWKSDGTESGTSMIRNINNTNLGSLSYTNKFIEFNNEVYFIANDNIHGDEIWKTDGTLNGTILLKDINPGISPTWINRFYADKINNKLLFFANSNNSSERKLWVSDGTLNGTLELANIKATNTSGVNEEFVTISNLTFFTGENESNGIELWSTDGTKSGTSLFADLNYTHGSYASKFTDANNSVFFKARGEKYGNQLFKSDGTINGTKLIKDISPENEAIDNLSDMKVIKGTLFFSATTSQYGYELWKSDGTESGTIMVKDIKPGIGSSMQNYNDKQEFTVIDDILYFSANDGVNGYKLWRSDGTESGTYMIKSINDDGSGYPNSFTVLNNTIYFICSNYNTGTSLWKTDGTGSGTLKVINLHDTRILKTVNNKLILFASTTDTRFSPHDLWVSDGTASGTKHLKTFGNSNYSYIQYSTILNNELYFVANNPDNNTNSVYKTDGTIAGTTLVFDGATHPTLSYANLNINQILTCGNYVYFSIRNFSQVTLELWRTNGHITEKVAGPDTENFSHIRNLTCYNENLLYLAETYPHKIWLINNNLNKALDININVVNGKNFEGLDTIEELGATNDKLYFRASNYISGSELYVTKINTSSLGTSDFNNSQDSNLKQVTLYPNPSSQFVVIKAINDFEVVKFQLWDSTGKKIDEQLNKSKKKEIKYDVSNLQTGIYFIKVTLSNGKTDDLKLIVN